MSVETLNLFTLKPFWNVIINNTYDQLQQDQNKQIFKAGSKV